MSGLNNPVAIHSFFLAVVFLCVDKDVSYSTGISEVSGVALCHKLEADFLSGRTGERISVFFAEVVKNLHKLVVRVVFERNNLIKT